MIDFLYESSICVSVFTLIYQIFYKNENNFYFLRYYFLGTVFFSVLIPLITIEVNTDSNIVNYVARNIIDFKGIGVSLIQVRHEIDVITWFEMVKWSYLFGLMIYFIVFSKGVIQFFQILKNSRVIMINRRRIYLSDRVNQSCSFFNNIVVSKSDYDLGLLKTIIDHEESHVSQRHSIDILVYELFNLVLWFNPFIYVLKHRVKENHEFLADLDVLKNGKKISEYQCELLSSVGERCNVMMNGFRSSLTKRRFIKMNITTEQKFKTKYVLTIPSILLLAFLYSCENANEPKGIEPPYQEYEVESVVNKKNITDLEQVEIEDKLGYLKALGQIFENSENNSSVNLSENKKKEYLENMLKKMRIIRKKFANKEIEREDASIHM